MNKIASRFSQDFKADIFYPLILFIIAVSLRLLPWQHVFSNGRVYYYDPDCYIRYKQILAYLWSFPGTFIYDYFHGFPEGSGVIVPPTMEYAIAAIAYPFRDITNMASVIERAIAIIPPILGGLTVVLMYRFMCYWFDRFAAVTAAMLLAFLPPHIDVTVLGRFDNEMTEALLLLLICSIYSKTYVDENGKRRWIMLGLCSALFLTIWRGALFPLSLIGVDLLRRTAEHWSDKDKNRDLAQGAALMYSTIAAIVAFICITNIWNTGHLFTFNIISRFHLLLFGMAAIIFFCLSFAHSEKRTKLIIGNSFLIIFLLTVILLRSNLVQGVNILVGSSRLTPWLNTIREYERGFHSYHFFLYGIIPFIVPFFLFIFYHKAFGNLRIKRFMILWTILMLLAAISRRRFVLYFTLNAAIMTGVLAQFFVTWVRERGISRRWNTALIAVLLLLQVPTFYYFSEVYDKGVGYDIKGDIEDTMLWMRNNTPSAGDPYRPYIKPGYGIMAHWNYSGWIESIAQRPSVTTSYGMETYGMEEAAQFFLSTDESEMRAVLDKNKVRYMIIDKMMDSIPMYAEIIGRKNIYVTEEWDSKLDTKVYNVTGKVFALIVTRLFAADGSMVLAGNILFKPVEGVRLVYESLSPADILGLPWEVKRFKVFEYNKGATVKVRGVPGEITAISQLIETNQGRRFTYYNEKVIGADGTTSFTLMYKNKIGRGTTGAVSPATIFYRSKNVTLSVADADIDRGETVSLSLQ